MIQLALARISQSVIPLLLGHMTRVHVPHVLKVHGKILAFGGFHSLSVASVARSCYTNPFKFNIRVIRPESVASSEKTMSQYFSQLYLHATEQYINFWDFPMR